MGELNRALQLPQQDAASGQSGSWDQTSKAAPIPGNKGQSFFLKDVLQK